MKIITRRCIFLHLSIRKRLFRDKLPPITAAIRASACLDSKVQGFLFFLHNKLFPSPNQIEQTKTDPAVTVVFSLLSLNALIIVVLKLMNLWKKKKGKWGSLLSEQQRDDGKWLHVYFWLSCFIFDSCANYFILSEQFHAAKTCWTASS